MPEKTPTAHGTWVKCNISWVCDPHNLSKTMERSDFENSRILLQLLMIVDDRNQAYLCIRNN